jgi:filamentous hemagglutinin family protein
MTKQYRNIFNDSNRPLWFAARASAFAALCAFGMQPLAASAQPALPIAADAGAVLHPTLGTSGNGTQVVNIVAPNAAGVSNNRFSQFNVGTGGVIVNNATQAVQTQIGGTVQANTALGSQGANLVLMQVTGGQASQLLGTTEVAGKGANLVLANPAGITCSGCGFLNAPRVTLATGTPTLNADGSLGALDVKQGSIAVQGNGLNGSSSAVDLIARAITVNAQVRGKSIDAIAGANRVDYATKNATAQAGTGDKPQVAIDVQSLGSMYGDGAVRLIGTEAGVGVRDNGALTSLTGQLSIASNGDVTIGTPARLQAGDAVTIRGVDVRNDGALAAQSVDMSGQNSLASSGTIAAAREAALGGDRVTLSGGSVKADTVRLNGGTLSNQGATVAGAQSLEVNANRFDNAGTLSSNGDVRINAQDTFANAKGVVSAQNSVQFSGATLDNSNGKIEAKQGALDAQAGRMVNENGTMLAGQALTLRTQSLDNAKGTLSTAGNAMVDVAADLDNSGGVINAGNGATVNANGALLNTHGSLKAGDQLTLQAATLDNRNGTLSTDRGAMQIGTRDILNGNGQIASADGLRVQTGTLDNAGGTIAAKGNTSIDAGGLLNNDKGSITSNTMVVGTAGSLSNVGGTISAPLAADIRDLSAGGGYVPPLTPQPPQPDSNPGTFDPGPGYVRVAMQDYDPNQYQSGFFAPDGYFYGYVGTTVQAMR